MRIIGGEFRSRRLLSPPDDTVTRPIPDRVKESLFGLLRGHCEGASVVDAFAGTGALGLEALSRGAARCVFVERSREAAETLRRNIDALGVQDRSEVVIGDALGPAALARAPRPVTIAFFDPPYPVVQSALGWKRVRTQLERFLELLTPDGFAILRTPAPFLVEVESAPAVPAPVERADPTRRRRERRGRTRDEPEGDDPRPARRSAPDEQPPTNAPTTAPHIPGDLSLPGAIGPETHIYGSTAVHLYMKKP